jgi:hypothetical protein
LFPAPSASAATSLATLESAAPVVPASVLAAPVVPASVLAAPVVPPSVLAATAMVDMGRNRAVVLARFGDPGKHGDGAAKRETGDDDSNQLGHGVLHSHGQTSQRAGHVSPHRVTTL